MGVAPDAEPEVVLTRSLAEKSCAPESHNVLDQQSLPHTHSVADICFSNYEITHLLNCCS